MTFEINQTTALDNHLLEALPASDFNRIKRFLEPVYFEPGKILYEPNQRIDYMVFPTTSVILVLYFMETGATAAVSVVGNDGMIGIAPLMGAETVPNEAVVQCPGEAFRIKFWHLQREFKRGGILQTLFLRFAMALLDQTSQIAACNRLHSIEKQLCRWLLLTHDRLDSDVILITHDLISKMLGVSRETVTLITKKLKQRKLIENARGIITIIDRHGLEASSCECYKRISAEYNRLFSRGVSRTYK